MTPAAITAFAEIADFVGVVDDKKIDDQKVRDLLKKGRKILCRALAPTGDLERRQP